MDVSVEFAKGVLFVRFFGDLNKKNTLSFKKTLIDVLNEGGIKYLVFNLNDCKVSRGVDLFNECSNIIKKNEGLMFMCGIDNDYLKKYDFVTNELSALRKINKCYS